MAKVGPIEIETGYGLVFLGSIGIWAGVPVLNSVFDTGIMTGEVSLPIFESNPLYAVLGGGLMAISLTVYVGHVLGWWQ